MAEYNSGGTLLRRYVHGPGIDEPLVWYEGTTTTAKTWLYQDQLGSVIGTANSAGTSTAIHSYGPFGEPNTTTGIRFRYTGQQYLGGLNLYYYKARFYSPALGRFLQIDPIGTTDDLNLYAYVGNNPINFNDPSGLIKAEADRLGAAFGGSTAAQALIPGQVAWNNMLSNFGASNYTAAAINGVTYIGETALFALTLGSSQAYMASARAALPAFEGVSAKIAPELGKKLEYFLGNATGNAHNIERSTGILRQLESIGLHDNPTTRQYLTEHLGGVLNDASNIVRTQANGNVVRESILMGPNGGVKLETVWDGTKLITGKPLGGR